jgi:hypothetical protein
MTTKIRKGQAPGSLERNDPDPTSMHGKRPEEVKALELKGGNYPKHLAGRVFGLVVHGDVAGIERRCRTGSTGWA